MTEAQWQRQVEELALLYGWRLYHPPDNLPRTTARGRRYVQNVRAGFPDLVLLRVPELIFAELKTDTGRVSADQEAWLSELSKVAAALAVLSGPEARKLEPDVPVARVDVYLWRPRDFEEVHRRLARGRPEPVTYGRP